MRAEIYRAVLSSLALCISLGDRAEIYYIHVMRNSFETEPARFVYSPVLDHPSVHGQDDTGAALDWTRLEALLVKFARIRQVVRAVRFWRCFAVFYRVSGTSFRTNNLRPAWRVICCSGISVALSYLEIFLTQRH